MSPFDFRAIFAATLLLAATAHAATWRVSPSGRDEPAAQPWKTPAYAATRANPGDTIFVESGTYPNFTINRSGSKDGGWINFQSQTPHKAKIICTSPDYVDCIRVEADYIRIDGFELENTNPKSFGSAVFSRNHHHITVVNCLAHGMGGAGAGFDHCDYLLVAGNIIHDTAMWNPYQTSAISFYMNRTFPGVDDDSGFRSVIRNNICYHNYNDAAVLGKETTDGNGIIIDTLQGDATTRAYPFYTLVEGNLCYDNGGKGIHVFHSDRVTVINNTCYHNNWDLGNTGTWRGELSNVQGTQNRWAGNIAVAAPTHTGAVTDSNKAISNVSTGGHNYSVLWTDNTTFNGIPGDPSSFSQGLFAVIDPAANHLGVDPHFLHPSTDPATCDFRTKDSK